jgi:GH43 family beta-xylosidase
MEGKLPVNEGPALMENNGTYFMTYSASYCWTTHYSLGLLTLRAGGNPIDEGAWVKSGPVFKTANGNYGPGHNGLVLVFLFAFIYFWFVLESCGS